MKESRREEWIKLFNELFFVLSILSLPVFLWVVIEFLRLIVGE